jgi:RimJ/RimL family protein N-acetyltransferase
MNVILETERIRLREFNLTDTDFIINLLNSPGWLQYIGDRNVRTKEDAIQYLQNGPIKSYKQNGFGLSMVELKNGQQPVGMCGLLKRDTLEHPDIGFAFLPEQHGQGYAFEIAKATISFAREKLNIEKLLAITLPSNLSSIKLLKKLGFSYVKPFHLNQEELLLYSL